MSETWIDEADQAEIPLAGGDVTEGLVRVGATVRQPVGPHSPLVHAYLHFDWLGARGCHFDFSCWSAVCESWHCLMLEKPSRNSRRNRQWNTTAEKVVDQIRQ